MKRLLMPKGVKSGPLRPKAAHKETAGQDSQLIELLAYDGSAKEGAK